MAGSFPHPLPVQSVGEETRIFQFHGEYITSFPHQPASPHLQSQLLLSGSISMALYGILLNAGVFSDLQLQLIPGAFV